MDPISLAKTDSSFPVAGKAGQSAARGIWMIEWLAVTDEPSMVQPARLITRIGPEGLQD